MPEEVIDYPRHRNRALRGAYHKGIAAGRSEKSAETCPYHPEDHEGGSWLDAFKNAWDAGWTEGHEWKSEQLAALAAEVAQW